MKKILTAFCASALAAALLLGMTACGGNGGGKDLVDKDANTQIVYSKQDLTDLAGWSMESASYSSVDELGWCQFRKTDAETAKTAYMLYNIVTAEKIESSESFNQITDGLYYTMTAAEDGNSATFAYYGKGGVAETYTVTADPGDMSGSQEEAQNAMQGIFADESYLYVAVDGAVKKAQPGLTPALTYEGKSRLFRIGDYYIGADVNYGMSPMVQIYNVHGEYQKSYNLYNVLEVPDGASFSFWYVGAKAFVQATYGVQGESGYDFIAGGEKMKVATCSYDPAEDKYKKIECPFVVQYMTGTSPYSDEYAIVSGYEIENHRLSPRVAQTLGEDGKYWADLQDLLPGTSAVAFEGKRVYLSSETEIAVFEEGKKVATLAADELLGYVSYGVAEKGGAYYNYAGELILRPTEEQQNVFTAEGKIYYTTVNEETNVKTLHILDAATKSETTETIASVTAGAYYITEAGADENKTYAMKLCAGGLTVFEGKALASTAVSTYGGGASEDGKTQYILVRLSVKGDPVSTYEYILVKAENLPNAM